MTLRGAAAVLVLILTVLCAGLAQAPGINSADLIVTAGPIVFVALLWPRRTPPAGDTVSPNAATTSPLVAHPAGSTSKEQDR